MDVEAAATRLHRVPPEEFVAERDALVAQARQAGETAAAKQLSGYRRPTRAAWLTNLLVGGAADEVEGLLALAPVLADAQRSLDGPALRTVSAQRTRLVGALARRAAVLGREAGQRVDAGLERDVRAVLEAALADPELADRVRTGRLVRAERHSGFGPVPAEPSPPAAGRSEPGEGDTGRTTRDERERTGPDAPDRPTGPEERARSARVTRSEQAAREEQERRDRERRDRERRERAVAEAGDRLDDARAAAGESADARDEARGRADVAAADRDRARRRAEELADELERAREAASDADRAARSAERTATAAARRAREADAAVVRAEEQLRAARED